MTPLRTFLLLVPLVLVGCAREEPATLANPAAVFCAEQGGTYAVRSDATGAQSGICVLASGETVDAWPYYRANAG